MSPHDIRFASSARGGAPVSGPSGISAGRMGKASDGLIPVKYLGAEKPAPNFALRTRSECSHATLPIPARTSAIAPATALKRTTGARRVIAALFPVVDSLI